MMQCSPRCMLPIDDNDVQCLFLPLCVTYCNYFSISNPRKKHKCELDEAQVSSFVDTWAAKQVKQVMYLKPMTHQHWVKRISIISEKGKHGTQVRVSQLGAKVNTCLPPKALPLLSVPCKRPSVVLYRHEGQYNKCILQRSERAIIFIKHYYTASFKKPQNFHTRIIM